MPTDAVADGDGDLRSVAANEQRLAPGESTNMNGTRKAGSVYFQVSIIVCDGLAAGDGRCANGLRARLAGETSESTA